MDQRARGARRLVPVDVMEIGQKGHRGPPPIPLTLYDDGGGVTGGFRAAVIPDRALESVCMRSSRHHRPTSTRHSGLEVHPR